MHSIQGRGTFRARCSSRCFGGCLPQPTQRLGPGTSELVLLHCSCSWDHSGQGAALRGQHCDPPSPGEGWAQCECRHGTDLARDLGENLIKAFSCFGPKFNPEWEALLFAWHNLHGALGRAAVPFVPEKSITGLPQCTTCLCHSCHNQSRLRSSTGSISLGQTLGFPFCL